MLSLGLNNSHNHFWPRDLGTHAGINSFFDILLSLLVWDSTDSKSLSHRVIHCSEPTLTPTELIPFCR